MQLEAQLKLCQSCLWCYKTGLRLLSQSSAHRQSVNYYDLLGIKSDATLEDIKRAFFDKSKKVHPDSDPSNPALHSQFVKLNEAYHVLSKESSRKEYDFKIRQRYSGGQTFSSASAQTIYRPSGFSDHTSNNRQYWDQFHQSSETTTDQKQQIRKRNLRLVGYCILTMVLSIGAHMVFFRKLEDVHNKYMDEKDRVITEIYNECKERARVNGFKKQTEILRQRHAEFQEKYKKPHNGDAK